MIKITERISNGNTVTAKTTPSALQILFGGNEADKCLYHTSFGDLGDVIDKLNNIPKTEIYVGEYLINDSAVEIAVNYANEQLGKGREQLIDLLEKLQKCVVGYMKLTMECDTAIRRAINNADDSKEKEAQYNDMVANLIKNLKIVAKTDFNINNLSS